MSTIVLQLPSCSRDEIERHAVDSRNAAWSRGMQPRTGRNESAKRLRFLSDNFLTLLSCGMGVCGACTVMVDGEAVLEKVHGMPGMGVQSISAFMKNVGHIEMALLSLYIPFKEITPQSWMKYYNLKKEKDESKSDWKRRLREHLQRIMPDFKVTNNTADAMLMAYYAMKHDEK